MKFPLCCSFGSNIPPTTALANPAVIKSSISFGKRSIPNTHHTKK